MQRARRVELKHVAESRTARELGDKSVNTRPALRLERLVGLARVRVGTSSCKSVSMRPWTSSERTTGPFSACSAVEAWNWWRTEVLKIHS